MTFKSDQDPDPRSDKKLDPDPRIHNTAPFCLRWNWLYPSSRHIVTLFHSPSLFSLCAAGIEAVVASGGGEGGADSDDSKKGWSSLHILVLRYSTRLRSCNAVTVNILHFSPLQ